MLRRILPAPSLLLALAAIILGFAGAARLKDSLETHRRLTELAASRVAAGKPADPVPSRWELIRDYEDRFLTLDAFRYTSIQTVAVGIAAMGMTMIIISGGIDLSVGSVMALSCVMTALLMREGCAPLLSAAVGVILGGICGLLNALLITRLKVVPFIVTLGMWGIARGLAKGLSGEQKIDPPASWLGSAVLTRQPEPAWLLLAPGVWIMFLLAVVVFVILHGTPLGRHIFGIGGNEEASRYSGVNVDRTKLYVYSIAGLCTGLAGVMQFCRLTAGDPTTAMGAELDVIAAVVIGGASLSGGRGSVFGSLVGAMIMSYLKAGCVQVEVPNWVQEIVIGVIIILAVALDYIRRRRPA